MKAFHVKDLSCGYEKKNILRSVSFSVKRGETVGILGANGSGKSTLLKAICGIIPSTGECTLDTVSLSSLTPKKLSVLCSYIPQRSGISIDISALDVVLMGFNPRLSLLEHPSAEMIKNARNALSLVGLSGKENDNYMTLSEGQKQLCILARTLAQNAELLLMDEPESALDFRYRYEMLKLVKNHVKSEGRAAVICLHDPSLALNFCDKLVLLKDGSILGEIRPSDDSLEACENMLSQIYGPVSLQKCTDKGRREHIVMLKEW